MSLRPAAARDCAALTAIMRGSQAYAGIYRSLSDTLSVAPPDLAANVVRIFDEGGAPRGFYSLIVRAPGAELDLLFVADGFQRRGIGRALFVDMAAIAASRGCDGVLIVSHPPAAGFYERMGASASGVEPPRGHAAWPRPRFRYALLGAAR